MSIRTVVAAGALLFGVQGCGAARPAAVPASPPSGWLIPADSVATLFGPANRVVDHPRASGPYPRDVVMLGFRRDASAAAKAEALRVVDGTVIGGNGAHYLVHVRAACADVPTWCAIDLLRAMPQVEQALPFLQGIITAGGSARR